MCSWSTAAPTRVLRVPDGFAQNNPTTQTAAGAVSLWTGELATEVTDATMPDPAAAVSVTRGYATYGAYATPGR